MEYKREFKLCKGKTRKQNRCKLKTLNESGFCFIHKKQEKIEDTKEKEKMEKKEKKILHNFKLLSDASIKQINLLKDITDNYDNWKVLFNTLTLEKQKMFDQGKILHDKYRKNLLSERDINLLKQHTQMIVQRDYRFSDLINHISLYNEQLQTISDEKKSISEELIQISKATKNINNFRLYYHAKLDYENKHSEKVDINKFRIGTHQSYNCTVCLETDTNGLVLDCGHKFHINCISNHFCTQDKLFCPVCRSELKAENIQPIPVGIIITM